MSSQRLIPRLLPVAFVLLAIAVAWFHQRPPESSVEGDGARSGRRGAQLGDAGAKQAAGSLTRLRSGDMAEVAGRVSRLLSDDNDGSRHQRFIVALADGATLLVAHNIDVAPRVPVATGDPVRVRGQYEHNDRGGVLHWTHHDPRGSRRDAGWIEHDGKVYR